MLLSKRSRALLTIILLPEAKCVVGVPCGNIRSNYIKLCESTLQLSPGFWDIPLSDFNFQYFKHFVTYFDCE